MDKKEIFDSLVGNAFDFLEKAISDFDEHPKFSMINFYTSIELFLKAILLNEHWTLIVSRRKYPEYGKFLSGDFQSITINEAEVLLKKVLGIGLSKEVSEIFSEVGKHRNRIIHFYHNEITDDVEKQEILKLQLKAWYHLNCLLKDNWKDVFKDWLTKVRRIEGMLKRYQEFLSVVFKELQEGIEKKKDSGSTFKKCPSCGFESQEHINDEDNPYYATCLVCNLTESFFRLNCPHCNETITLRDFEKDHCPKCTAIITESDLLESIEVVADPMDGAVYANCEDCGGHLTVGKLDTGKYFCVECFTEFDKIQMCEYCNEYNTGDMENSYFYGCSMCDGKEGQL